MGELKKYERWYIKMFNSSKDFLPITNVNLTNEQFEFARNKLKRLGIEIRTSKEIDVNSLEEVEYLFKNLSSLQEKDLDLLNKYLLLKPRYYIVVQVIVILLSLLGVVTIFF